MKFDKKGQIGRVLLYVIMLVIFVSLLIFGYSSVKDLGKQSEKGVTEDFDNKISDISESLKNEFGAVIERDLKIGDSIVKMCILDYKNHRDDILSWNDIISQFPIIKENLELNISDNVYYYTDTGFSHSSTVKGICVPTDPYFYCVKPKDKQLTMKFEGKGDCSAVSTVSDPFLVNENNIRDNSKYGNLTLAIYPKSGDISSYKTNVLRLLTLFMYKTVDGSVINPIVLFDNLNDELSAVEVFNLQTKHSETNLTYYENKPLTIDDSIAIELEIDYLTDYLAFWDNYYEVVLVKEGESDKNYLTSAIFASNINAPLIIYETIDTNYNAVLGMKKIYVINKYSFALAEQEYLAETYPEIIYLDAESLRLGLYFAEHTGMFRNPIMYFSSQILI